MVAHTCQAYTQEMEAEESRVQGQSQLHFKFKTSLGDMKSFQ